MKTYTVKETFRTIQGEGRHAGTPAIFLRLAGCNLWSGRDEDRLENAVTNVASCPKWCDTDFRGGTKMNAEQVREAVNLRDVGQLLLVITGGEPLLQVDASLLDALYKPGRMVAIETNGTVRPKWLGEVYAPLGEVWITMSPKVERRRIMMPLSMVSELKLVWPDYLTADWLDAPVKHKYLQPRAKGPIRDETYERSLAQHLSDGHYPGWIMSLQQHKVVEVP